MAAELDGGCVMLATLGSSWAVVPEIYGWLAPEVLDLYAAHPEREKLDTERREHSLIAPQEIWICTTDGEQTRSSVSQLLQWWRLLGADGLALRTWVAAGTDQLASADECRALRELTFRLALKAREHVGTDGTLILSLAGGRKTMSADLQDAGHAFGARAWLHVVGREPISPSLKTAGPADFAQPLPKALAGMIRPLFVGHSDGDEALRSLLEGRTLGSADHPLPDAVSGNPVSWAGLSSGFTLQREVDHRRREAQRLLAHFAADLTSGDDSPHWPSLLRLDAGQLQLLQDCRLSEAALADPRRWPLADLHRHLGGCLDLESQKCVAAAIWSSCDGRQRDAAGEAVATWWRPDAAALQWPTDWPGRFGGADRAAVAAMLLLHTPESTLEQVLWDSGQPRVGLKTGHALGFAAYERPGELSGSALLIHPAALDPYAEAIVRQAKQERLLYVELRGSPHKYRPDSPGAFVRDFRAALKRAGAQVDSFDPADPGPRIGFLWIVDRRQRDTCARVVRHAVAAHEELPRFVLGLDLAGAEGTSAPHELAAHFEPAFRSCMRVTIHAGEGEPPQNIWEAAYHLHADRIGHGLTLAQHPMLMQRFRDRGVALELCPTSNREVVGFADPAVPESTSWPPYPITDLLRAGVPLTINTDNPGISRTTLADEYLTASRMAGGFSPWVALRVLRAAYDHAFVPAAERAALTRAAERRLLDHYIGHSLG